MPHAYTEDQLVEQPAIGLFAELGWGTATGAEEIFGVGEEGLPKSPWKGAVSLGRDSRREVVLLSRLRDALYPEGDASVREEVAWTRLTP